MKRKINNIIIFLGHKIEHLRIIMYKDNEIFDEMSWPLNQSKNNIFVTLKCLNGLNCLRYFRCLNKIESFETFGILNTK